MRVNEKQERNQIRTIDQLLQRYNLEAIASIQKATENNTVGLNKTNASLEQFIIATVGSLVNMQSQIDGSISTWFENGEPTLGNKPANEWTTTEEKDAHLGDLYYDRDTGYGYRFSVTDGVYEWFKITDNDVVAALAIANAAKDTADGKRRVFTDTPFPPYDVGDLWLTEEELYVCSLAKAEDEAYDENDFGKATKYTGDERAEQVALELREELVEQYTSIMKTSEEILVQALTSYTENSDFERFRETVTAQLQLMSDQMTVKFEQQTSEINAVNGNLQEQLNTITKYFTFDVNGLIIGQAENPYKMVIDNDRFSMTVNDEEVMWIANGEINTPGITIEKRIQALGYSIEKDDESGNVNIEYIGGE